MDIKNTKNKSKRSSTKNVKPLKQDESPLELSVVEISDGSKSGDNMNNNINASSDIVVEKTESIVIEKIENPDNFLESPKNTHKKFTKIYFFNILKDKKKVFATFLPWTLLVILLLFLFYFWFFQLPDIKTDSAAPTQIDPAYIIETVGKVMLLPNNEVPQISVLSRTDINQAKALPFFANAVVGDYLLVYSVSGRAILFDPQINKIVEVANISSPVGK